MYKAKRVAWHKHLKKARKAREKTRVARASASSRQTTPRR